VGVSLTPSEKKRLQPARPMISVRPRVTEISTLVCATSGLAFPSTVMPVTRKVGPLKDAGSWERSEVL
jgi:hypothetical protein